MYDHDNLKCMINCLEEFGYEYTKYDQRNGCCTINSDLLIKQLKLNEKEIRNKAIDEFAEKMEVWNENIKSIRKEDAFFTIENIREIAEHMKGGV